MNQKGITRRLDLNKKDYYLYHLSIINPLLPIRLTLKEIEVLAAFISYQGDIASSDRFGTSIRKQVRKDIGISFASLSAYLKSLQKKGFIYKDSEGNLNIWELAFPSAITQRYFFEINLKTT
jgi:DNA-binding MarR family transcriptional regulator